MFGFIYLIALLSFYKIQRKICSQSVSKKKKFIIPIICMFLSIIGIIYINDIISNHSNQLKSFSNNKDAIINQTFDSDSYSNYTVTDDSTVIATISISKKRLYLQDVLKIFLIFNIPTLLFTLFIYTGNRFKMNLAR